MSFAAIPFAESTLAGVGIAGVAAPPAPGEPEVPLAIDPFTIEINGISLKPLIDTLSIDVELGRQGTASFTLANVVTTPRIGEPVRIKFYEEILFVGAIDSVRFKSNHTQTFKTCDCECTDNSYLLFRKKVTRTFTNASLAAICNSFISNELDSDGITLGTIDSFPNIPVIEGDSVSIYDILNDAAVSVGALFFIDNDKRLNFIGSSIEQAPMSLDENTIEDMTQEFDRETYRNKQTIVVTGTPVVENDPALTVTYTTTNNEQIAQQAAVETTNGIYNDIESITHPTSNFTIDLNKLAVAYARILLAVRGSIRETLNARTRQYGFRAGQSVTVLLPHLGITGNWIIQRLGMRDLSGRWLISDLQLSTSSLRRRAQELWIEVVRKGNTVILPPTAIVTNLQTYSTPGSFSFAVPADITMVQVTCSGAGAGGGGGAYHRYFGNTPRYGSGGAGGNGGLAITVLSVTPGETLTITVPSGGTAGVSDSNIDVQPDAIGTNGGNGGDAKVDRAGGFTVCLAYGGSGGIGARMNSITGLSSGGFGKSPDGGGLFGHAITVGGGMPGGGGGNGIPLVNGTAGTNGRVIVEW